MSKKTQKTSTGERIGSFVNVVVLVLFAVICTYPFYYVMCYALSDPSAVGRGVTFYPREFTFDNLIEVFRLDMIPQAFLVSVCRTVVGTIVTVFCCSFFAYLVSKREMYLRTFIYRLTVFTMYVTGGLIPTYLVYRGYGLRNTFWIYILPGAVSAYNVILIKTFMEQLPDSLEDAATVDGAGFFTCFLRVVIPLSKPILATIAMFSVVGQWNSWFDTHIYVSNTDYYTLQYVLYRFLQDAQQIMVQMAMTGDYAAGSITPFALRMAITVVVTLPILFIYPFAQRYYVKGIMIGAVKG